MKLRRPPSNDELGPGRIPSGDPPPPRPDPTPWVLTGLAVAAIGVTALGVLGLERVGLRERLQRELASVARVKASHVAEWREQRLADGRRMSTDPLAGRVAARLAAGPGDPRDRRDLAAWARSHLEHREYVGVVVTDPRGARLASAGAGAHPPAAAELERAAREGPLLLDPHEDAAGVLHTDLVVPLFAPGPGAGRRLVAAVDLRVDPAGVLFPLVQSVEASSPGTRSYLAGASGKVVCACERHGHLVSAPGGALLVSQPIRASAWSIVMTGDAAALRGLAGARPGWILSAALLLIAMIGATGLAWRRQQEATVASHSRAAREERLARLHVEEARRESEDRFRAAFFGAGVGAAIVDREGRFIDFNEPLARMLGYPPAELRERSFQELLHPDDREASLEAFAALISGARDHNDMQRRYVRKDGGVVHARYSVDALRSADGEVRGAVAVVQDVTASVAVEEELRRSKERLELALDAAADGVWDWDVEPDRLFLSAWFEEALAAPGGSLGIAGAFELIHPDDRPDMAARLADLFVGPGSTAEGEHRMRGRSGDWLWVHHVVRVAARNERGAPLRVVGACTDVTEARRLRGQLLVAERMASLGVLAAGIAHEISNPLAYVIGNLSFAREALGEGDPRDAPTGTARAGDPGDGDRRAAVRAALDDVAEGVERVRLLASDVKMLSRGEAGTGTVDVHDALHAAIRIARHEIVRRARLRVRLDPVPRVRLDDGRLGQVFLNLLVNAAQAIGDGDPAVHEVAVSTRRGPDGSVVVEVRDTGCGIPADVLGRIFEPFFTTKGRGVGTGLGLAICQGIVSSAGGEIQVETEVGRGSAFRVVLPAAEQEACREPAPPRETA